VNASTSAMSEIAPVLSVYTIGHSNRPFETFVALLASAGVRQIVDVRRFPGSRANPQYNADSLGETLPARQIGYTIVPALGGRRSGDSAVPREVNGLARGQDGAAHHGGGPA
jgi:uncharacterized protein (DUF488 family)